MFEIRVCAIRLQSSTKKFCLPLSGKWTENLLAQRQEQLAEFSFNCLYFKDKFYVNCRIYIINDNVE